MLDKKISSEELIKALNHNAELRVNGAAVIETILDEIGLADAEESEKMRDAFIDTIDMVRESFDVDQNYWIELAERGIKVIDDCSNLISSTDQT